MDAVSVAELLVTIYDNPLSQIDPVELCHYCNLLLRSASLACNNFSS